MNTRRAIIFVLSLAIIGSVTWWGLTSYWSRKQPMFENAPRLIAAVQAYTRDRVAQKVPVPPRISLQQLVEAGYIFPNEIEAFNGMAVTISLAKDEINSRQVLMRVRLIDGSETALMVDGGVETLPPSK